MLTLIYNERNSLKSRHGITLEGLTYCQNQAVILLESFAAVRFKSAVCRAQWISVVEYVDCISVEG